MTPGATVATEVPERVSPLELAPTEFRRLGHDLVNQIADFLESLRHRPLTSGETPAEIRALLGRAPLPDGGTAADGARPLRHPEHGRIMTVDELLALYAWHGDHHTAHVTGLRDRMGWH